MKPCSKNRKPIAWLAIGPLNGRTASALRDHLTQCEGCRRYLEEISNVTEGLASATPDSDIEASEFFHQRVAEKLRATESTSVLENLTAWLRESMLTWRVALPAIALLVIALVVMVAPRHPPLVSAPAPPTVQVASALSPSRDLAPTLANYQMVASQSLEKLDELLTRQGNKPLPPAPVLDPSNTLF